MKKSQWINTEAGKLAVSEAYEQLTGKPFHKSYATTHNGGKEPAWSRIKRAVINGGSLTRIISGGVRIGEVLKSAGCPNE